MILCLKSTYDKEKLNPTNRVNAYQPKKYFDQSTRRLRQGTCYLSVKMMIRRLAIFIIEIHTLLSKILIVRYNKMYIIIMHYMRNVYGIFTQNIRTFSKKKNELVHICWNDDKLHLTRVVVVVEDAFIPNELSSFTFYHSSINTATSFLLT